MKKITSSKAFSQIFLKFSYVFFLLLFLVDFVVYPGAIQRNVGVSPLVLLVGLVGLHLFFRVRYKQQLSDSFVSAQLLYLMPSVFSVATTVFFLEKFSDNYINYFLTDLGFHYQALLPLGLFFLISGLVHASKDFWRMHAKHIFFLVMFWLIAGAIVFRIAEPLEYKAYTSEDSALEYLTALGFLLAGIATWKIGGFKKYFGSTVLSQRVFVALCIFISIGFFLVAGEEISWGQRLLGIATPESISSANRQNEINLHNLDTFWPYIYPAYLTIGLYGALASIAVWLIKDILPENNISNNWRRLLAPPLYLALNFLLIVVYVWLRERHGPWKYVALEELSELLLILGITIHLFSNYRRLKNKKSS